MSCLYCGDTENLETDHLIPSARGGLDIPENTFPSCRKCNASKGNRTPSEWRKDLPIEVYEKERLALNLHPNLKKRNNRIPKEEVLNIRMTTQQKAALEAVANREGLGLSTWLLHVGLIEAQKREEARR